MVFFRDFLIQSSTFVLFTSDHGYHLGQHSLTLDKRQPYETDLRVPMSARGPGVRRGQAERAAVAAAVDVAPTLMELAGAEVPRDVDGTSLMELLMEDVSIFVKLL